MIDSGVWIAYLYDKDENNMRAKQILSTFLSEKQRHMTDYGVLEVTNFLMRKSGFNAAKEALELLTSSKKMQIIYNDEPSFKATREIFLKYLGLSFTDANMAMHMKQLELNEILSFDAGFDKVKEIKRIH